MDSKAIRGVPWTLLTYAVNKLVTLGTTLVLARLLVPADFGVVALATLVIGILGLFKDLGLGGALIVRKDLDEVAMGTVQTMMLATGAVVTAAIVALAPWTAELLDEPRLKGVLMVMALSVLIGSVGWFYETLLQRDLEFRKRFVAQAYQNIVYATLGLGLAFAGAGVWSIVVGFVGGIAVYAAALVLSAPVRVRPCWDLAVARDMFRTGQGFLVQGGLGFVQQNVDKLAVGGALGSTQLGYYSMSYRLSELPYMAIAEPVARVTFPEFARMHHEGEDVAPAFLAVLRLIAIVTVPLGVVLSGAADPFVEAVLGQTWAPMTASLAVLGIWASVRTLQVTVAWLLNSLDYAGLMGIVSAFVLVPLIPGAILAAHFGGIEAVAWVMLADISLSLATLSYLADRRCGVSVRRQWSAAMPAVVAAAPAWGVSRVVAIATEDWSEAAAAAASLGVGMLIYAVCLSLIDREALRIARAQIARTIGRGEDAAPAPTAPAANDL